jgi:general secretion pathway protein A
MDYEAFFKLKERPFKNPWEAKFYFRVPAFDEIRETLINAPRPEFLILRGQPGVGKSALLRRLPWALKEKTVVAPILLTGHRLGDILRDALIGFGLGFKCSPQVPDESLLGFFQNAVSNFIANNYGLALAADGAATLTEEDVEDLLRLLSLEPKWRGQTTLLATDALKSPWPGPKFPGAKTLTLPPLDQAQTAEYVRFRLQAAGGKKDLFPQESLHKVHALSEGSPAAINALCERALLTAWAAGKKEIAPHFLTQAKASLENPLEIAPQAKRRAAGYSRDRQKIRSTPIRLALAASLALVFSLGFVFWPKSDETGPEKAIAKPAATQALPAAPVETATPAADPASMGPKTGLSLPTPPPILLSLPHNANALVVDQSSGQARLWRGQLRTTGLKAELVAPELAEPGLYLMGRPKSRMSLVFQYPPGREVPPDVGE